MRAYTQEMAGEGRGSAGGSAEGDGGSAQRAAIYGVMDYYNMKNIAADTEMRETIAGREGKQ